MHQRHRITARVRHGLPALLCLLASAGLVSCSIPNAGTAARVTVNLLMQVDNARTRSLPGGPARLLLSNAVSVEVTLAVDGAIVADRTAALSAGQASVVFDLQPLQTYSLSAKAVDATGTVLFTGGNSFVMQENQSISLYLMPVATGQAISLANPRATKPVVVPNAMQSFLVDMGGSASVQIRDPALSGFSAYFQNTYGAPLLSAGAALAPVGGSYTIPATALPAGQTQFLMTFFNGGGTSLPLDANWIFSLPYTVGATWTARSMPAPISWSSIAWGNGRYVSTVYANNVSAYSNDGISWNTSNMPGYPTNANWISVAFGNGRFVAVDQSTVSAVSVDGVTWTPGTLPGSQMWSLCFGDGKFVAISNGGNQSAVSSDGINWTAGTLPSSQSWTAKSYGNGRFVALAFGTTIAASSPDGINWTSHTLPSNPEWQSVAYGNGRFIAVAGYSTPTAQAATSLDGQTWSAITMPSSQNWGGIEFGNGQFVATSGNMATSTVAASSPDGSAWTARTLPGLQRWGAITYHDGIFYTVAVNSSMAASSP